MVFLGQIIESVIIIDCQDLVFNLPYVYKCAVVHPVAISQCDEPVTAVPLYREKCRIMFFFSDA